MKTKVILFILSIFFSTQPFAEKYASQEEYELVTKTYVDLALKAYESHLEASAENDNHKSVYYSCLKRKYLLKIKQDALDNIRYPLAKVYKIISEDKIGQDDAALYRENPKLSYSNVCRNFA